ncbi:efflux RND transporter periplasmic adaptor subunit [Paenibacillus fonticola]|uniref:efflux RND transporter periplasmic adaptor subunit n=1 Tax=Paenibacillus fonticola TaxID=379896 RepID=UPI000366DA51|nr:efflux RND transporter periplasmic adaptor subunit [Paenibacillus fonticola]
MKKKWLWLIAAAGILLIIAFLLYIFAARNQQGEPPAVEQNTAQATKGDIVVSVSGAGSVIATESEAVRTKEEGVVDEVKVEVGSIVKKGQVLLTFEANDLSHSISAKESSLELEQLNLNELQEKYKREVHEGASEESLASTKLSITKQEKNIQTIKDDIASLKEDMIAPDPLLAPIGGTITTVNISPGERAKEGNELFTIIDYEQLSTTVSVDELDIAQVQTGMRAEVTLDAIANQTFAGSVTGIANEGQASNGVALFDVTVKLDNPAGIRVGMSAEVTIILDEKAGVLTLPIEAVRQIGGDYMVILPSEAPADIQQPDMPMPASGRQNRANSAGGAMQKVEVGVHDETRIEIISGLNEGDEVVVPTVRGATSQGGEGEQRMMPGIGMPGGSVMPGGSAPSGAGMRGGAGISGGAVSGGGMSGSGGGIPGGGTSGGGVSGGAASGGGTSGGGGMSRGGGGGF